MTRFILKFFLFWVVTVFTFIFISFTAGRVFAHEQYVLTTHQLNVGLADKSLNVLNALKNPENVKISFFVSIGIIIALIVYFLFQYSKIGKIFDKKIGKLENIGHVLIRISLGISLIASAYFNSFLGPEIPAGSLHLGSVLVPILYILGVLLVFGLFVRIVSLIGFILLLVSALFYGQYMITYFNYYGEYVALILFGSYFLSLDNKFFGISKFAKKYKNLEILILRTTYGLSVLYPAITIKLLHPMVIVEIYNKYHMGNIWWLFPKDPLLTSLGTGMAQILVGVLIIIGLETRFAAFLTFLLYLGSILYFQEAVWPHIVLLALAFYFVINNGGKYTLDFVIGKMIKTKKVKKN